MGRGRAKAKQTKVARQLKYSTPNTDLDALQRELSGGRSSDPPSRAEPSDEDSYGDDDYDGEPAYADEESDPESADDSEEWRAAR